MKRADYLSYYPIKGESLKRWILVGRERVPDRTWNGYGYRLVFENLKKLYTNPSWENRLVAGILRVYKERARK